MPPLNLASRPFRNERLPALLLALGFTLAGAISIKHAIAVRALMPGRTSGLSREVRELEDERERLRTEAGHLRAPRPEPAVLAQWTLLKDLVDRRTFSWSALFAVLEDTLPKGVRLVSIAPKVEKGDLTVGISAVARTNEDVLELIRVLEDRPEFDGVLPQERGLNEQGTIEFRLTMKYTPQSPPPVATAANAGPASSPAPPASPVPSPPSSASASASATPSPTSSPAVSAAPSTPRLSGRESGRPE